MPPFFSPLRNLRGKLSRRLAVLQAALDTIELPPDAGAEQIAKRRDEVARQLKKIESDLSQSENGKGWLAYLGTTPVTAAVSAGGDPKTAIGTVTQLRQKLKSRDSLENEAAHSFLSQERFLALERATDEYLTQAESIPASIDLAALQESDCWADRRPGELRNSAQHPGSR